MNAPKRGRRQFLKESVALAGMALGAAATASAQTPEGAASDLHPKGVVEPYGVRSRFEKSVRLPEPNATHQAFARSLGTLTPLREIIGTITPSGLHYVANHGYYPPVIDPEQHRLLIHGMVDRPLIFTMEELRRLPSVSRVYFLECQANKANPRKDSVEDTHGKTACSEWTGVPLALLLKEAGVQSGADWIVAEGDEAGKHAKSVPLSKVMKDVLLAYGQNGEPVRPENGYPLRLMVPGFEAIYSVKWVRRIKLVDRPYMEYQEVTRYTTKDAKSAWFNFEMGPKSVITFPAGGQRMPGRGYFQITGLAWSGGGAIRRVEISTDGGKTWNDAEIQGPALPIAHTRFGFRGNGKARRPCCYRVARTNWVRFSRRLPNSPNSGASARKRRSPTGVGWGTLI